VAFKNPIVTGEQMVIPGMRSQDYVEGKDGWRLGSDGSAQFNSANIIGDLGTNGQLTAESIQVGEGGLILDDGTDVGAVLSIVTNDLSGRVVGYFQQTDAAVTGIAGTELRIINLDCFLQPGRIYSIHGMVRVQPSAVNASDQWQALIRGTTGPSAAAPTTTSTVMAQHVGSLWQTAHPESAPFDSGTIPPDTPLRLTLTVARIAGTDTLATASATNSISPDGGSNTYTFRYPGAFLFVLDHGPSYNLPLFVGYNSTDTPPSTPPAPTPRTYTKVFSSTWSRTYDGDLTTTWDDTEFCYQGYYSSDRGNTRSLCGFDYAAIQSALSGATVNSVKLTFKVAHSYYNAGMTVEIGGHIYSAKPSTWSGGSVAENQTSRASCVAGSSYTVTLPASFGTNFKSGAWKGISFGPGPSLASTYYGYMYGYGQSGRPYLTFTYTK
jgi:hypothetical protein